MYCEMGLTYWLERAEREMANSANALGDKPTPQGRSG